MAIDMENHGYPGGILDHGDQGGARLLPWPVGQVRTHYSWV
jgi:hypothetical protein